MQSKPYMAEKKNELIFFFVQPTNKRKTMPRQQYYPFATGNDIKTLYFLIIISIVIALTTFLQGCDDNTFCNTTIYTHIHAKVIENDCNLYKPEYDDGITYQCKVKFEYVVNNDEKKYCHLHRSDMDGCDHISTYKTLRACNDMNQENYKLNHNYTVLFNRKTKECDSMHYTKRISMIGIVFMVIAGVLLLFVAIIHLLWVGSTSFHSPVPMQPQQQAMPISNRRRRHSENLPTITDARIINTMPIQIVQRSGESGKKEIELIATIV